MRPKSLSPIRINVFLHPSFPEYGKKLDGLSREAQNFLMKYDYPGNVLENIVERAVVISRGPLIATEDLPFGNQELKSASDPDEKRATLRKSVEALEKRLIAEALEAAQGNQTRAASTLSLSERMLGYKLKKYRLK